MYCLDTNILVGMLRGDASLKSKCFALKEEGAELFITPVTLCELYRGAYLSDRVEDNLSEIHAFILSFSLLEFSDDACSIFGKEYARLQRLGNIPPEFDLIIASIAKANDLVLITRDKKDFENIDIKIKEW